MPDVLDLPAIGRLTTLGAHVVGRAAGTAVRTFPRDVPPIACPNWP